MQARKPRFHGVVTFPTTKENPMDDVLYLGLTALFFPVALLVLKGVERL